MNLFHFSIRWFVCFFSGLSHHGLVFCCFLTCLLFRLGLERVFKQTNQFLRILHRYCKWGNRLFITHEDSFLIGHFKIFMRLKHVFGWLHLRTQVRAFIFHHWGQFKVIRQQLFVTAPLIIQFLASITAKLNCIRTIAKRYFWCLLELVEINNAFL